MKYCLYQSHDFIQFNSGIPTCPMVDTIRQKFLTPPWFDNPTMFKTDAFPHQALFWSKVSSTILSSQEGYGYCVEIWALGGQGSKASCPVHWQLHGIFKRCPDPLGCPLLLQKEANVVTLEWHGWNNITTLDNHNDDIHPSKINLDRKVKVVVSIIIIRWFKECRRDSNSRGHRVFHCTLSPRWSYKEISPGDA